MAKPTTKERWENLRRDAEAGIQYPALARDYGVTIGQIRTRSQAEGWQTVRRKRKNAKLAPPISVRPPACEVSQGNETTNPILAASNSPQFRAFLESLKSMEPAEFSRNLAKIAQVKIVDGLIDWESINLSELKTWIDIQRKAADYDKPSSQSNLTLTVSAPRSLTRRKSPVIEVAASPDESDGI